MIPVRQRERLGIGAGGTLQMVETPEGLLLERSRGADVRRDDGGVPVVRIKDGDRISNDQSVDVIHDHRQQR